MAYSDLFDEQQDVFKKLLDFVVNQSIEPIYNKNRKIILSAPAGTGKTFVARNVMRFLQNAGISCSAVAFTGRAAAQLARDGMAANTCHSILYKPVVDGNGDLIRWEQKTRDEIISNTGDVLLVDEGSMIPKKMYDLFMGLGIVVIFLGDYDQLDPVDPDSKDFNVMLMKDCPSLTLKKSRRFDDESGIGWICSHLREQNSIPRVRKTGLTMIPKSRINMNYFIDNSFEVIITGTNKLRKSINNMIRNARGFHDEIPEVGEIITCLNNSMVNNIKINNGERYKVLSAFKGEKISKFFIESLDVPECRLWVRVLNSSWELENDAYERNLEEKVQKFAFGYAMSCHRCQGSSFDSVLFVDEDVSYFMDQKKYRYTGVSRAMNKLTIAY